MTHKRLFVSVALAVGLLAAPLLYGESEARTVTTTLLPMESGDAINRNGFVVQQAVRKTATLDFDLGGLPQGLARDDFSRCTLRIVASKVTAGSGDNTGAKQVIIKGHVAGKDDVSIVSLSRLEAKEVDNKIVNVQPIAVGANPALCTAIYSTYKRADKNNVLSISLFTDTDNASSLFYSVSRDSVEDEFSRVPRLVIEYKAPPVSFLDSLSWDQVQHDPEHTGRSPWKPFTPPSSFTVAPVTLPAIGSGTDGAGGTVADYPLVYQGNLYIIYKTLKANYLVCLDFSGTRKRWEANIGTGVVQGPPVISANGLMYVVTEKKIAAYDLNRGGVDDSAYSLTDDKNVIVKKLTGLTDLTVGNDGSVFLALQENNVNYMFGFTSKLRPFIRSTSYSNISTITVSASGDKIFAQTAKGAAVLDIANPKDRPVLQFMGGGKYHVPVAGPIGGVMLFATSNKQNLGNVRSYGQSEKSTLLGTDTSQPVLGGNGRLYFVQNGKIQGYIYDSLVDALKTPAAACSVNSNLVADGSDNIYSWHGPNVEKEAPPSCISGSVQSYKPDGVSLGKLKALDGPETNLRFELAPDGTLWTNNTKENKLYALKPTYATPNLTVKPADIKTHTVYRANGDLTVAENVTISGKGEKPGMEVLFEAKDSISFAKGFRVEKGASLLCRTGF